MDMSLSVAHAYAVAAGAFDERRACSCSVTGVVFLPQEVLLSFFQRPSPLEEKSPCVAWTIKKASCLGFGTAPSSPRAALFKRTVHFHWSIPLQSLRGRLKSSALGPPRPEPAEPRASKDPSKPCP